MKTLKQNTNLIKILVFLCAYNFLLLFSCSNKKNEIGFDINFFHISLSPDGEISNFIDKNSGTDYLAKDILAPLLSLRIHNVMLHPESASYNSKNELLTLNYKNSMEAGIKVVSKKTHITFELIYISNPDTVELVVWGPYPTLVNKIIGETIGVVRGEHFAIGIQALNPKTLGGYPWSENDCMPQLDILEQDDFSDLSESGKRYVLYRVEGAKPTEFGSTLQAYCRNRNVKRVIQNWNHDKYTAPVFDDGGVIGSKIALFGCPVDKTLETIGAIEVAEGLPHPKIDGIWGKQAPSAAAAYLIMSFGEEDIERALKVTQKAGLRYLYHPGPFENWGHFKLNEKQFPNGIKSMQQCVNKAKDLDIMLGVHTLSNFITGNDPYVTPVPDKRLARVGSSIITENIDKKQLTISIESPDFFNQFKNNHLKTVVIGDELIRYGEVSEQVPWILTDCQRGAFKTTASPHVKGEKISKLADHAYKVFLTNPELTIEAAKNIADLFNQTGLRQISFDGLEGNRSTGMGNYGEVLFTKSWYDNLNENIKGHHIADESRTHHYFWHIYTRMNWGEPWYAGFRESQTSYRLKNQKYFARNLMPGMLGWFKMTPETSIEDIEWMLARSAAFDAGYAFVTNYEALEKNGYSEDILKLLGEWEKARMSALFTDEQKGRMEDINNEFHLEIIGEEKWNLYQVYSYKFKHIKKVRQPGEPLFSTFTFDNPASEQVMNFILTAVDGNIDDIRMEIDNYKEISLPVQLKAGETIKYSGGDKAAIYNKNWRKLKEINMNTTALILSAGEHSIKYDCSFSGDLEPYTKLEIRFSASAENLN